MKGKMKRKCKTNVLLAIGILSFSLLPEAHGSLITGGISFSGGAYANNPDLSVATLIYLSPDVGIPETWDLPDTEVESRSGDFKPYIPLNSSVTMYSPLHINPTQLPDAPVWEVGGFSLKLDTLTSSGDSDSLTLSGRGTISSTNPLYDDTPGTWVATFNSDGGFTGPATFSWSASSGASVPDGGGTAVLLGSALILVGAANRFRCRQA
jgi:hypothetical protein